MLIKPKKASAPSPRGQEVCLGGQEVCPREQEVSPNY